MVLLWMVIALMALYGIVALCGSWLLHAAAAVYAAISAPFRAFVDFYKNGQKKRAYVLAGSVLFAIFSVALLCWLLVAMPE